MKDADKLALIQKAIDEIADDVSAGDVDVMELAAFYADVKAYMDHSADVDEKLVAGGAPGHLGVEVHEAVARAARERVVGRAVEPDPQAATRSNSSSARAPTSDQV